MEPNLSRTLQEWARFGKAKRKMLFVALIDLGDFSQERKSMQNLKLKE